MGWVKVGEKTFGVTVKPSAPTPTPAPAPTPTPQPQKGMSFWEVAAAIGFSLLLLSAARGD